MCILAESILRQLGPYWQGILSADAKRAKRLTQLMSGASSGKQLRTVNLRDDHPTAIRLVLLIATHQYKKVPKKIDFLDIVRLTETADRYGLQSLLTVYVGV